MSHLSKSALPFRERFMCVPNVCTGSLPRKLPQKHLSYRATCLTRGAWPTWVFAVVADACLVTWSRGFDSSDVSVRAVAPVLHTTWTVTLQIHKNFSNFQTTSIGSIVKLSKDGYSPICKGIQRHKLLKVLFSWIALK